MIGNIITAALLVAMGALLAVVIVYGAAGA